MAVAEGATTDGLNLAEVPSHLKGVTCYFCHNVAEVEGLHNNPLRLANDTTMRGPIPNPARNGGVHVSAYSSLLDGRRSESSSMCGACHDIVTLQEAHIERTFLEWRNSVFAKETDVQNPTGPTGNTCNQCHMTSRGPGPVAIDGPSREGFRRNHMFAGIDVALTPWPQMEEQKNAIQDMLDFASLQSVLCVADLAGGFQINVILHALTGHSFPSGASADGASAEVIAYRDGAVLYQSGVEKPGEAIADPVRVIRICSSSATATSTRAARRRTPRSRLPREKRLLNASTTFGSCGEGLLRNQHGPALPYEASRVIPLSRRITPACSSAL